MLEELTGRTEPQRRHVASSVGGQLGRDLGQAIDRLLEAGGQLGSGAGGTHPSRGAGEQRRAAGSLQLGKAGTDGGLAQTQHCCGTEAAEAWLVFTQTGYEVDTVTVQPGRPPIDGLDEDDETQQRFFAAVDLDTLPSLADLDPAQLNGYDAVFLPGGHGTVWDFPSAEVGQLVSNVWQSGGAVGAVCHGPSGLVAAVDQDGTPIVSGRRVTGFSNAEEHAMELQDVVPYLLADKLESLGGQVSNGPDFTEYVVRDGRLVTGQNPQSTFATAHALVEALAAA